MTRRITLAAALLSLVDATVLAQSSATYAIKRMETVSGSLGITSAHFEGHVSGGGQAPGGSASFCNNGNELSLGFWSLLGPISVPIVLNARKNHVDPANVDLYWSGNAAIYQVFRSSSPEEILNPANHDRDTPFCGADDHLASQSAIVFYMVVPKP
jgi:hypothetical protein